MAVISELRKRVSKDGYATIFAEEFNLLQSEWIRRVSEAPDIQSPEGSALNACSATAMRELKTGIIEMIRSTELNDDQELCLDSQELIVGWIDVFIENKIFDEGPK